MYIVKQMAPFTSYYDVNGAICLCSFSLFAVECLLLNLSQYFAREEELVEFGVLGIQYLGLVSLPCKFAAGEEQDVVTNVHHRVHIVCVHYGGYSILLCDVVNEFIYYKRCLWVEARVRLVAE